MFAHTASVGKPIPISFAQKEKKQHFNKLRRATACSIYNKRGKGYRRCRDSPYYYGHVSIIKLVFVFLWFSWIFGYTVATVNLPRRPLIVLWRRGRLGRRFRREYGVGVWAQWAVACHVWCASLNCWQLLSTSQFSWYRQPRVAFQMWNGNRNPIARPLGLICWLTRCWCGHRCYRSGKLMMCVANCTPAMW